MLFLCLLPICAYYGLTDMEDEPSLRAICRNITALYGFVMLWRFLFCRKGLSFRSVRCGNSSDWWLVVSVGGNG